MSLSRVCRRAAPLFKSTHHLPLESRCIPNYDLSGGSTTSSVYQRHFGHDSMWRPKLGSFNKCSQHQPFAAQSLLGIQRLYSSQASTQEKSRKTLLYLTGLVFAMVAASYAAVPLYRRFCQATGYGGTIQRRESVEQKIARHAKDGTVATREIVVQFNADVADGMPWKFIPTQREVRVKPGESALAFYTAENRSSTPIVGVSTYNVTPMKAAVYFNKIQCFCFEEQRLLPGEQIDMPVFFYIDPEFETDPRMDACYMNPKHTLVGNVKFAPSLIHGQFTSLIENVSCETAKFQRKNLSAEIHVEQLELCHRVVQ